MAKVRVKVEGTIGKSIRFDPDATVGAQIGANLQLPDGTTPSLTELAAALGVGIAAPVKVSSAVSGGGLDETAADLLYLRLDGVNDPVTGRVDFEAGIRIYDALATDYLEIVHNGTDVLISALNTSEIVFLGTDVAVRAGASLFVYDGAGTASVEISHDGTNAAADFTGTTDFYIEGLTGRLKTAAAGEIYAYFSELFDPSVPQTITALWGFRNSNGIRIEGPGGTDYVAFSHDGTDLNTAGVSTTDWNITGITKIQAGTVDADFDVLTATSYGGIAEANLVNKAALETIAARWTFSSGISMQDTELLRPKIRDYSLESTAGVVVANAVTCNFTAANSHHVDLEAATGDVDLTVSGGPPSGEFGEMVIRIQQDSTADRTLTWLGGTFIWAVDGVEVEPKTGSNAITVYHLQTWDAGTTWYISAVPYGV